MIVALKSGGINIPLDRDLDHVYGYGVGLDMTRRDLQGEMKKADLLKRSAFLVAGAGFEPATSGL